MTIVMILASVAMPLSRVSTKRSHEIELRQHLRIMRAAIDSFKAEWNRDGECPHWSVMREKQAVVQRCHEHLWLSKIVRDAFGRQTDERGSHPTGHDDQAVPSKPSP